MEIVSLGPLRAGSIVWQPRPGAFTLTVVCKATYVIEPHESRLAEAQDEPLPADVHHGDDRQRSLRAAGDLAPFKPRADVTLVGHACAPGGRPTASLVARIIVGTIDKAIEVFPDRAFTQDGHLREGPRFVRMPLVYERAGGGPGTINPVGIARGAAPDRFGRVAVPNLQAPGVHITSPAQYIDPIGFGPIAAFWPSRLDKLHRHGASFSHRAWMQQPLPVDMDFGYFNVAPADQQVDVLRSNERIILEDLHPDHPRLVTSLPGVSPRAVVERKAGSTEELAMHCDTLSIDVDRRTCALVWRAQLALEHANQPGRITISTEGQRVRTASMPPPLGRPRDTVTADVGAVLRDIALPFREKEGSSADLRAFAPDLPPSPAPSPEPPMTAIEPPAFVRDSVPPPPPARPPMFSIGQLAAAEAGIRPSLASIAPMERGPDAGSVLAASNHAAGGAPEPPPAPPVKEEAVKGAAPEIAPPEILDLLWFDPKAPTAVRTSLRWQELLEEIQIRPPEVDYDDDPAPIPQPVKDRNDIFGLLAEAPPSGEDALDEIVAKATSPKGRFEPPLALVAGELAPAFEEAEILKAAFAAVAPFTSHDKRLKDTFDAAVEALESRFFDHSSAAAAALTARLKEAFSQSAKALPAGYLEGQIERAVAEKRKVQSREVLGETNLLARLTIAGASLPIPVYLPPSLATKLPISARFPARLLTLVHLRQDDYEAHRYALRALALARVSRASIGRRSP